MLFQLKLYSIFGVYPLGAHVLAMSGVRETPASSTSRSVPLVSSSFFYIGDDVSHPAPHLLLIPLPCGPLRLVPREPEGVKDLPDVVRMVLHVEFVAYQPGYPLGRPDVRLVPVMRRALEEHPGQPPLRLPRHRWWSPRVRLRVQPPDAVPRLPV